MAFKICERHGGHIAAMVCSHLADTVHGRVGAEAIDDIGFVVIDFGSRPLWRVDLCAGCAAFHGLANGLNRLEDGLDDDECSGSSWLNRLYALPRPVCSVCYREWMVRVGICCPFDG